MRRQRPGDAEQATLQREANHDRVATGDGRKKPNVSETVARDKAAPDAELPGETGTDRQDNHVPPFGQMDHRQLEKGS